jgi:outer membrane protein assembly factor BamA
MQSNSSKYVSQYLCQIFVFVFLFFQVNILSGAAPDSSRFFSGISHLGERIIDLLTFEKDDKVLVIYPAGGYSPRGGLSFGVMPVYSWYNVGIDKHMGKPNTISGSLLFSTQGMVDVSTELERFFGMNWQMTARFDYLKITDRFWGIYSQTDQFIGMHYQSVRMGGQAELLKGINERFFGGVSTSFYSYTFNDLDDDLSRIQGFNGGFVGGAGPLVLYDSRDHVLWPKHGLYIKGGVVFFPESDVGDYRFSTASVDFRFFRPAGNGVIALQALWDGSFGDVPFFSMPQLGGKDRLRGVGHSQRIIDKNVLLARGEWRIPVWWRIGAVFFGEMGQASNQVKINHVKMIYSGGAGLRFRILPDEPLNIRVEVGVANGGHHGFFISLKEAF